MEAIGDVCKEQTNCGVQLDILVNYERVPRTYRKTILQKVELTSAEHGQRCNQDPR